MIGKIENFLFGEEREEIKSLINELKPHWKPVIPPNNEEMKALSEKGVGLYTLGDATYVMEMNGATDPDRAAVNLVTEKFDWLHGRLINEIESTTQVETKLHEITVPGFHISTVDFDFKMPRYHLDSSMCRFDPRAKIENIFSLVSVIDMPEDGAFLDYLTLDPDGAISQSTLNYEFGSLHIWNGSLHHRIGNFKSTKSHPRITFQSHLFYDPENNCNWLYF